MNDVSERPGPHPGWVAVAGLVLSVAVVALPPAAAGSVGYVDPLHTAPGDIPTLAVARAQALKLAGFLLAGSAVPLTVCAATWAARLRERGLRVPGPFIALAGGVGAATSLLASAAHAWVLGAVAATTQDATALGALAWLTFLLGGAGFAMPFGLLLAGIAVPGLLARVLPRPIAWIGLVLALACELTWLTLQWPALSPLLPACRFGGLVWLVVAGFTTKERTHGQAHPHS